MPADLSHLPLCKRRALGRVLQLLFEAFEAYRTRGSDHRRRGRILTVVLFGSHASGDRSDYDVPIVVNHDQLVDSEVWRFAEQRLLDEQTVTKRLKTPINLVIHTIADINDQPAKDRYFFRDIIAQGVSTQMWARRGSPWDSGTSSRIAGD